MSEAINSNREREKEVDSTLQNIYQHTCLRPNCFYCFVFANVSIDITTKIRILYLSYDLKH